jgi:hypothetical protein
VTSEEARRKQQRPTESASAGSASAAHDRERVDARRKGAAEGGRRGCLFCRKRDVPFTSVEHIFPESLGNKELTLPIGVVCDRCNNGPLSKVDAALCAFGPIPMMRLTHGVESKAGKLPEFHFDNGSISSDRPGNIHMKLSSQKWLKQKVAATPGHTAFSVTGKDSRYKNSPKKLQLVHRALVKIAVECAWNALGEERLLSPEFDREREMVLHGGYHGYLLMPQKLDPQDLRASMHYDHYVRDSDGQRFLGLVASIFGCWLITDTLNDAPEDPVPGDCNAVTF